MGRAPCCEKDGLKRGLWMPEEDHKLVDYIQKHGYGNWRNLPKNAGLRRCGKSCRLRWNNYLRPDINLSMVRMAEPKRRMEMMTDNATQSAETRPNAGQLLKLELLQLGRYTLELLGVFNYVLLIEMYLWQLIYEKDANFFHGQGPIEYIYRACLILGISANFIAKTTRLGSQPLFVLAKDSLESLSFEFKMWATFPYKIWILINLVVVAFAWLLMGARELLDILKEIIKKPPVNTMPSEVGFGPAELEMIPV